MKRGFTMIEIVVVVAMVGIILVATIEIMLNSTKAKNKTDFIVRLDQVGNTVIAEMRRNLINGLGGNMACYGGSEGVGSSAISFENIDDGYVTDLICFENGQIASESGRFNINLMPEDIRALNCQQFISCSTLPSGAINSVDIGFTLAAGVPEGVYAQRSYRSKVTIRN